MHCSCSRQPAHGRPQRLCLAVYAFLLLRADNALSVFNRLASHLMRTQGQSRSGRLSSQSSRALECAQCS